MPLPSLFISSRQNAELNPYREWAVAELRCEVLSTYLQLWRFEDQPASAREPEAIYLDGVASSAVVMFIAGSDTSDATATEISAAVDHGIDILCLILPADSRSARVSDLISRVRDRGATTKDVAPDEDAFRYAVAEAAREWLISRIQGGSTQNRRAQLQSRLDESVERCFTLWLSADLDEDLSRTLANDESVGAAPQSMIPTSERPFVIIAAPVGSGKSITTERLLQAAIHAAQCEVLAPVPVRLAAHEIINSLRETVEASMTGLGSLAFNGVALFIDALDEVDEARAQQIIRDAHNLRNTYRRSRVILAGRHAPEKQMVKYVTQLPPFSHEAACALMQRVSGEEGRAAYQRATGVVAETLLRPLFALVLARNTQALLNSENDVADLLIAKALTRSEQIGATSAALRHLAAKILDSPEARVAASEIAVVEQRELLNTRLVFEDGSYFRISLRIVAERAASQWLAGQLVDIVLAKAQAGDSSDRWKTSLIDYVRGRSDKDAVSFVLAVALTDPVRAVELAKADNTPRSIPWIVGTLQLALDEAEATIALAFPELYAAKPSQLFIKEYNGDYIVTRESHADNGLPNDTVTYTRYPWIERQCAFLFAAKHVVALIDEFLGARSFLVSDPIIDEEVLWNFARVILSLGPLADESIELDVLEQRLTGLPQGVVTVLEGGNRRVPVDTDRLRTRVAKLRSSGVTTWPPPFVTGDQALGSSIWSNHSDESLLKKRRETVLNAMQGYAAMADRWLPVLRSRMQKYLLMPALLRERLGRSDNHQPVFSAYWIPLPSDATNSVDITFGERFDFPDVIREMQGAIIAHRLKQRSRIRVSQQNGVIRMWSPLPVREMAYQWLLEDLKHLGFSKHVGLPHGD